MTLRAWILVLLSAVFVLADPPSQTPTWQLEGGITGGEPIPIAVQIAVHHGRWGLRLSGGTRQERYSANQSDKWGGSFDVEHLAPVPA